MNTEDQAQQIRVMDDDKLKDVQQAVQALPVDAVLLYRDRTGRVVQDMSRSLAVLPEDDNAWVAFLEESIHHLQHLLNNELYPDQ